VFGQVIELVVFCVILSTGRPEGRFYELLMYIVGMLVFTASVSLLLRGESESE